jgi:hypothetical protein
MTANMLNYRQLITTASKTHKASYVKGKTISWAKMTRG